MAKILIQISRNDLHSGEFGNTQKTIHTNTTESCNISIALDFLYRFFAEVVLND